jgi:hypothetical protein
MEVGMHRLHLIIFWKTAFKPSEYARVREIVEKSFFNLQTKLTLIFNYVGICIWLIFSDKAQLIAQIRIFWFENKPSGNPGLGFIFGDFFTNPSGHPAWLEITNFSSLVGFSHLREGSPYQFISYCFRI